VKAPPQRGLERGAIETLIAARLGDLSRLDDTVLPDGGQDGHAAFLVLRKGLGWEPGLDALDRLGRCQLGGWLGRSRLCAQPQTKGRRQ